MTPPTTTPKQVKNPRRVLLVAPSNATASTFLKDLTGTPPPLPDAKTGSLSGKSHVLTLNNRFYVADVPIWIDIVEPDMIREWADEFSSARGKEVLAAVGGYVVLVNRGEGKTGWDEMERVLKEVGRVVNAGAAESEKGEGKKGEGKKGEGKKGEGKKGEGKKGEGRKDESEKDEGEKDEGEKGEGEKGEGEMWDGVCLGVLFGITAGEEEEVWLERWEAVDGAATGKNEFGERVGVERVREVLEANDWSGGEEDVSQLEAELGIGGVDLEGGFEIGVDDVEGMRRPLFGKDDGDEEESVEGMEALMLKMQAMRDLGADMPEAERKKFAAKAVRDLMKTL